MAENGKNGNVFKVMFWLMTAICGLWLLSLTNGVVANERLNVEEHKDIRQCITDYIIPMGKDIAAIKGKLGIEVK